MRRHRPTLARRPRGFTIIEAAVSVVVVGSILATAVTGIGVGARLRVAQQDQARARELGEHLLAEILQRQYKSPGASPVFGPEAGEQRAAYDDVDDYDELSESPPTTPDGAPMNDFAGWRRAVTVEWVDPVNIATTVNADKGLKRVTVTVTGPGGRRATLVALRSQYGAFDRQPRVRSTYVSSVGVTLQAGADPSGRIVRAVNPLNQPP